MPRFQGRSKTIASGLADSAVPISILLIECVFLFALGYFAFIRFDVR